MLAIVIPYYKIKFFEATLQSLSIQTDKRFNVYIGDDSSPDNPINVLKKWNKEIDFKYHRFDDNLGKISLSKHWDRCISLTNDENWLMVLGDDDFLSNNAVESFYEVLSEFNEKANVVRFASKMVNEKLGTVSKSFEHPKWEKNTDSYFRKINNLTRSSLSEHIFSKEIYLKYKFRNYALAWHSDDMAWIDFCNEKPIYTINKSKVFVRFSDVSISGKEDNESLKSEASLQFMKDLILEKFFMFDKNQRLNLLMRYEVELKKNRKISLKEYSFLTKLYLNSFNLLHFFKFIRRTFIYILK